MKVYFTLSRPNAKKPTAIKLGFSYRKNFIYGTGIQIHPDFWDLENKRAKEGTAIPLKARKADPELKKEMSNINGKLRQLEAAVITYLEKCKANKTPFNFADLKDELDAIVKPDLIETPEQDPDQIIFVRDYIARFINGIINGEITTPRRNTKYSRGTIKAYRGFQQFWKTFEKNTRSKIRFTDVDMKFYRLLIAYCHKKEFKYNYTGRIVKDLKVIMENAYREGLHENLIFRDRDFQVLKTKVDEVYLTQNELGRLYRLDLSDNPVLEKHRDVFLIGCYTALRFSDIVRIRPDHVKQDPDSGSYTLEIITQKTKAKVTIPVRPELLTILQKYDFKAPKVFEQKVNADIKKIAKMAGISGTLSKTEIIGGQHIIRDVPRHELVKTHTARRTAATLMYLAKISPIDIMKITGHTKEETFLNYIKTGNNETAERLRENKFFAGSPLKIAK